MALNCAQQTLRLEPAAGCHQEIPSDILRELFLKLLRRHAPRVALVHPAQLIGKHLAQVAQDERGLGKASKTPEQIIRRACMATSTPTAQATLMSSG